MTTDKDLQVITVIGGGKSSFLSKEAVDQMMAEGKVFIAAPPEIIGGHESIASLKDLDIQFLETPNLSKTTHHQEFSKFLNQNDRKKHKRK